MPVDTGTVGDDNMLSTAISFSASCARNIAMLAASSRMAAAASAGRTQRSNSVHQPSSTSATRAMMRASSSFQYESAVGAAYSEPSPRTTSSSSCENSRMSLISRSEHLSTGGARLRARDVGLNVQYL